MSATTESILTSVKKLLGPGEEYDAFDPDIIMHINSGFGRLCELGIGPSEPFEIEDNTASWEDFQTGVKLNQLKRFFFLYVKTIFDPSANGVITQAYKEELNKLEWLMCSVAEVGY